MLQKAFTIALPARWSAWQRRKNTALFHLIQGLARLIKNLPRALVAPLGDALGTALWLLTLPFAGTLRKRVARALPEQGWMARHHVVWGMWRHLARSAFELGHLEALVGEVAMPAQEEALLADVVAQGQGAIIVSGHVGHWELLAQWAAAKGWPLTSVAKPLYDPRLTHWVDMERRRMGLKLIWRGQSSGTLALLRALKAGDLLAMLIDQDTRVEGAFVPFFGQMAHTPTAPARLALRRRLPLLVCFCHRTSTGFVARASAIALPPPARSRAEEESQAMALTKKLNHAIESAIRRHPEQWVWLHNRWRRQPDPWPASKTA